MAEITVRRTVHNCFNCYKNNPVVSSQIMADLPKERVTRNFAFHVTGIDYSGFFLVKLKKQRKGVLNKI